MHDSDATPPSDALSITMTATSDGLARVIALLHRRGARVRHLNWVAPELHNGGQARMTVIAQFEHGRSQNLRTSLSQLVDVLDVRDNATTHHAGPTKSGLSREC